MNEQRRGTYTQWNVTQPQEKNEIMPFAAIQKDLEIIMLSKSKRERQIAQHHLCVESKI